MSHPVNITNQTVSARLSIEWDDGLRQNLSYRYLRSRCQCADCKTWRKNEHAELTVADDIRLAEIRLVGQYGMQLIFSDGHDRGIYPWPYLRELLAADGADADVAGIAAGTVAPAQ